MQTIDLTIDSEGVYYEIKTPVNIPVVFSAKNIRNEKTGIHAELSIEFDDSDTYTVCNIKRKEERGRLVNEAYKFFGSTIEEADYICPKKELVNKFNKFCKLAHPKWIEVQAPQDVYGVINESPLSYIAKPHVLSNGGTIMYGKPGRGKSFTGMALAIAVNSGANHYWETEKQNAMFVNLERPDGTMAPRVGAINRALGLNHDTPLPILDAKNSTLMGIHDPLVRFIQDRDIKFVVIDSLSQAGNGDMKEDTVATDTVKILNKMGVSWLAIAHTPKYDDSVYYGNSLWEAGADVMLRHASERDEDGSIVALLEVTKANDMPIPQPMGLHYSFDKFGLNSIRFAESHETIELETRNLSVADELYEYLGKMGSKSATQLAKELGKNRSQISRVLSQMFKKGEIQVAKVQGNEKLYGLKKKVKV